MCGMWRKCRKWNGWFRPQMLFRIITERFQARFNKALASRAFSIVSWARLAWFLMRKSTMWRIQWSVKVSKAESSFYLFTHVLGHEKNWKHPHKNLDWTRNLVRQKNTKNRGKIHTFIDFPRFHSTHTGFKLLNI